MVRGSKEKKKYMWRSKDEALKHKKICICTFPVMHVKAASVLFASLPLFHAVKLRTAIITVVQPVFYEPINLCSVDFYMLSFCRYDSCWYNLPHPHLLVALISQSPTQASLPPPGNSILIPIIAECGSVVNHTLFNSGGCRFPSSSPYWHCTGLSNQVLQCLSQFLVWRCS